MLTRWKLRNWSIAIGLVLVALACAFLDESFAYAQGEEEDDYVDLALSLELPPSSSGIRKLDITVKNHGSRTAYGVEVVVDIVYPGDSTFFQPPIPRNVPVGSVSMEDAPPAGTNGADYGGGYSLRWTISELEGFGREEVSVRAIDDVYDTTGTSDVLLISKSGYPHEFFGEVTTSSFESHLHKGNNTDRVWSQVVLSHLNNQRARPTYRIEEVWVDERNPSPGDIVNFTINSYIGPIMDAKVAIELTGGLAVDEDPNATPPRAISYAYIPSGSSQPSYSNRVFTIGTREYSERIGAFSATVPVRVSTSAVVSEQCLTATVTALPPPGPDHPFDDDISDNLAKLCLGEPPKPKEVFQDGTATIWTLQACLVSLVNDACDTADRVDVRVLTSTYGDDVRDVTPVIHVKDAPGRVFDSHAGSVTSGAVSWQTATDADPDFTGTRNGVKAGFNRSPVNSHINDWEHYQVTFAAEGLGGGDPPGKVSVRSSTTGNALWPLTPDNSYSFKRSTQYRLSSRSDFTTIRMVEFETLGTYVVDFVADVTHATIDEDGDGNKDVFSGTGRSIFHVGPIAELGVGDGGISPDAAADQVAFTVAGFNDRGETYESGRVVVELPAGTTGLTTVPASTGVFDGNADPPTWTWDIRGLEQTSLAAFSELPRGVIVTLIVEGVTAGDTATANVVYDPYEVCIGSNGSTLAHTTEATCVADTANGGSWHEGTVYDYNADNNTATLTARAGGVPLPGTPEMQTPEDSSSPSITVAWGAVDSINGLPVSHYEVQRQTNPWATLADDVEGTEYLDDDVDAGETYQYRVRAVNEAGVAGPWSEALSGKAEAQSAPAPAPAPCRCPAPPTAGKPEAPVLKASIPGGAEGQTRIDLAWEKPIENGAAIISYTLEVSDSGSGPWSPPDSVPYLGSFATEWSHTGLTAGTRKYYRMKATNREGDSPWSDIISAMTRTLGKAGPPENVGAAPGGDSAIDVWWEPPRYDGGSPITHYEVQWSTDGIGNWTDAGRTPDATTRYFRHDGITGGTTLYYRVAAHNGVGLGDWSDPPVSATTSAGVPGQPDLTARATAPDAIELTWTVPADGGSPISGYRIESSPDGNDPWTEVITTTGPGNTYTDYGTDAEGPMFTAGRWPHYRVAAVNSVGTGPFSEPRDTEGDYLVLRYDANRNGALDIGELFTAIDDYFAGVIDIGELFRLIDLYFSGPA